MTTLTVHTPVPVEVPRGAPVAAALFLRLLGGFERAARAVAQACARRAAASEARELREFAQREAAHDPRFAADLLAAADRHEFRA